MSRVVFLDRDGVINELVLNPVTGRFESPHRVADYRLRPGVLAALVRLYDWGTRLFLISNQPSFALGKTTLEELFRIHRRLELDLAGAGVVFEEYYYCYHHPNGVVEGYAGPCRCRKPAPYFLQEAARKKGFSLSDCWMIGDQDTDMECGWRAGCRTILLETPQSKGKRGKSYPDYRAADLPEAVDQLEAIWNQEAETWRKSPTNQRAG